MFSGIVNPYHIPKEYQHPPRVIAFIDSSCLPYWTVLRSGFARLSRAIDAQDLVEAAVNRRNTGLVSHCNGRSGKGSAGAHLVAPISRLNVGALASCNHPEMECFWRLRPNFLLSLPCILHLTRVLVDSVGDTCAVLPLYSVSPLEGQHSLRQNGSSNHHPKFFVR